MMLSLERFSEFENAILTLFIKYMGPPHVTWNVTQNSRSSFPLLVGTSECSRTGRWVLDTYSDSSLVPRPHLPRGKWSGEPSWISWAHYWNVV